MDPFQWFKWLADLHLSGQACGCGPPDVQTWALPTTSVDFESVAKLLSELPRGIGGRHPNGLPW